MKERRWGPRPVAAPAPTLPLSPLHPGFHAMLHSLSGQSFLLQDPNSAGVRAGQAHCTRDGRARGE